MELLEQGEASLVSVDLARSSKLEHNLYRNCRLALSIMLQRSWALGKERLLSHWSRRRAWHAGSRHVSVLMSQLTGDNHVLQSRVVQSQGLLGESPGRQSVLQSCSCGSLVEKQSVASYLGLLLISWKLLPGKSNLAAAAWDLWFWQLLPVGSGEKAWMNYSISTSLFPLGASRHNLPPPELALLIL